MTRAESESEPEGLNSAWADLPASAIAALIKESRTRGWREALLEVSSRAPFFYKRMSDLGLLDWNVLLLKNSESSVLDVGCGFGSGVLGLASSYARATGVEFLRDRVEYASLRARQETSSNCSIARGSGHVLPFSDSVFSLVTMNGVLEWAGLYERSMGPPECQLAMLREAGRVLQPDGTLAVAIENRFAAESLSGLQDTHTNLFFVTAMPRWLARLWSRLWKGEDYRTFLYSRGGYRKLFRRAGFTDVRLLDLVSSYNDYDFAVQPHDILSYRYLYENNLIRPFFGPAATVRRLVSRLYPRLLGEISYAYLIFAGKDASTVLDSSHAIWQVARNAGLQPDEARFACKSEVVGGMTVLTHDGATISGAIELMPASCREGLALPDQFTRPGFELVADEFVEGRRVRVHRAR